MKCEFCEQETAELITRWVQTIPGSLDTKTTEMQLCRDCAEEYDDFLKSTWHKSREDAEQVRIESEMAEWGTPRAY